MSPRFTAVFISFSLALLPGLLPAEIIQLNPSQDNTLFEDAEGDLSNGAGAWLYFGRTDQSADRDLRRALLQFDLSGIPANATVESVELQVEIDKMPTGDGGDTAYLHRVTEPWGEAASNAGSPGGQGATAQPGDATWLHRSYSSDFWTTPGGAFEPGASSTALYGSSAPEVIVFSATPDLVTDVQQWVSGAQANHGWIILGNELTTRNARRIGSRECEIGALCFSSKPLLTVEYSVPSVTDNLSLELLTANLGNPVGLANAGDGSGRLFIVEQGGRVLIWHTDTEILDPTPFLDIQDEVFSLEDTDSWADEMGLLGLVFHPDYASNGRFFVNYTSNPAPNTWRTVVAEHRVTGDPDVADNSGTVIMEFEQERLNHNGGDMHFGPDGYLYIASGDGGGGGDPEDNAQDVNTLRGAMLRIDVDSPRDDGAEHCGFVSNYGIPPGNAFPGGSDGCDAILHIGLRNPWRFSFDGATGDLLIADVGQGSSEEINHVAGDASGLNFGWPCREGTLTYNAGKDCGDSLTDPAWEYNHSGGNCSVTGGYVYRGGQLPINGQYLFGDYCTRRVWLASGLEGGPGSNWNVEEWEGVSATLNTLVAFGQGEDCELYVIDRDSENQPGALYRIIDTDRIYGGGFENRSCRQD